MTTELIASTAYKINEEIVQCNYHIRANFLRMAELLCRMRDERLYAALDCKTFEEYLGTLGAEGTRSWLYKLMRCYELFAQKLTISNEILVEIGPSKLDILAPVASSMMEGPYHTADWLDKARELSKSDLITEVRLAQGKPALLSSPAPHQNEIAEQINGLSDLLKYANYQEYVEAQACILCGKSPVDKAHFPKTKGAGASDDFIIPACRECHSTYHLNPLKWMHDYQGKWAAYFYGLILKIWERKQL